MEGEEQSAPPPPAKPMTPERARELQAAYEQKRREHREMLGLGHGAGDRNTTGA